ncbi:hypothetical protein CDD82_7016 [Ophiocordyceps australis]|uniref:Uncharacterized protein n=1 Tax=Ophiocordyceps australis TaxID=1399860 RepID=A0A2C5YUA9_9HYPO|nr:hypothetical protein CDD82_7016 [Ophiocordyceps australis]
MSSPSHVSNHSFMLEAYMLLKEQHEELCTHLEQIRTQKTLTSSTRCSSTSSSQSSSQSSTSAPSSPLESPCLGSARRQHCRPKAQCSGWYDAAGVLDTIVDEDTLDEISSDEKRLFDVNEGIKRALTELLNSDVVRGDKSMRMWAQTRLMETERELRTRRRRRSPACME